MIVRRITELSFLSFLFLSFLSFKMTSLSEENTLLRRGLEIFASELEQVRSENARLEAERVLSHELTHLRAECARLRKERNAARHKPAVASIPRFILENHVSAEKAKRTECPMLMVPLSECRSVTVSTVCGHIFDTEAFKTWNRDHCAVCRTQIGETAVF